jgi:hypothetical protein
VSGTTTTSQMSLQLLKLPKKVRDSKYSHSTEFCNQDKDKP